MGLAMTNNNGTRWTRDDVRTLNNFRAVNASNDTIARAMGRTIDAVVTAKRDLTIVTRRAQTVTTRGTARATATPAPATRVGNVCASCYIMMPLTNVCESCD